MTSAKHGKQEEKQLLNWIEWKGQSLDNDIIIISVPKCLSSITQIWNEVVCFNLFYIRSEIFKWCLCWIDLLQYDRLENRAVCPSVTYDLLNWSLNNWYHSVTIYKTIESHNFFNLWSLWCGELRGFLGWFKLLNFHWRGITNLQTEQLRT